MRKVHWQQAKHTECQVGRGAEKQAEVFNKPEKKKQTENKKAGARKQRKKSEGAGRGLQIRQSERQGKKLRHNSAGRGWAGLGWYVFCRVNERMAIRWGSQVTWEMAGRTGLLHDRWEGQAGGMRRELMTRWGTVGVLWIIGYRRQTVGFVSGAWCASKCLQQTECALFFVWISLSHVLHCDLQIPLSGKTSTPPLQQPVRWLMQASLQISVIWWGKNSQDRVPRSAADIW